MAKKKIVLEGERTEEFDGKPEFELYNPLIQPIQIRISLSEIKMPCWGEFGKHKRCEDCIFRRDCQKI